MLTTFSVMPLAEDHFEERCADIVRQRRERIAQTPLFMFKLLPEGRPAFDKAEGYRELFIKYRDALAPEGIVPAVLVQSSLGHGYPLDETSDMQMVIGTTTGKQENCYCPLDPKIHDYMEKTMEKVASFRPSSIMMDDDFRLFGRPCKGCVCDRHMALFNERTGNHFTAREWSEYFLAHDENDPLVKSFIRVQTETLADLARTVRRGVDRVDCSIPVTTCNSGSFRDSPDVAKIFAGEGNPVIVRGACGSYAPVGLLGFSDLFHRGAASVQTYENIADTVIAETDCICYNRYSKSSYYLHAHFLGNIMDGVKGAKHWITRFNEYTPETGEAYRKILAENAGLYEKTAELVKDMQWVGCRIPFWTSLKPWLCGWGQSFSVCFLERVGIPFYSSEKPGGAVCVSGPVGREFAKETLEELRKEDLFLDSGAAESLERIGLGDLLGVTVSPWEGAHISGERFDKDNFAAPQMGIKKLSAVSEKTKTESVNYHTKDKEEIPLFPAVTSYVRENGKQTVVFSGTPQARHDYTEAFSFLNASRKSQFIDLLSRCGHLPVYYPGDAQVLLRAGKLADGRLLVYFLNTGDDELPEIPLVLEKKAKQIALLSPKGEEIPVEFIEKDGRTLLSVPAVHMMPRMLLITL